MQCVSKCAVCSNVNQTHLLHANAKYCSAGQIFAKYKQTHPECVLYCIIVSQ